MDSFSPWRVFGFFIATTFLPLGLGAQEGDPDGDPGDAVRSSPAESDGIAGHELAENIRGRQVVNAIGDELGEISGIIISGDRVTHAIVSIGGFVGLGGSDVVVPFGVLRFDAEQVTIDTLSSSDQLEGLTLFEPGDFGLSE
ncbi:PRC-barrel domain containing protein [Rhodovulum sp. 12E13]|uniref:PRC-barrel domain-containing protein n=1 Tax=Rhodovulum sp. 12E13 TaxID=2203891 RepID=UPI000E164F67|nr:PRC-barrel domain-containing protein [Rhodovulum sp. 12E13]RDC67735.1 PRC-barrel domain containing protein [Rhodovulum sp. 12E13]